MAKLKIYLKKRVFYAFKYFYLLNTDTLERWKTCYEYDWPTRSRGLGMHTKWISVRIAETFHLIFHGKYASSNSRLEITLIETTLELNLKYHIKFLIKNYGSKLNNQVSIVIFINFNIKILDRYWF